jgi:hypothetical protein
MKQVLIEPDGWPTTLAECPPGPFMFNDSLCFKSEYRTDGKIEAFCESGEFFWGGTSANEDRNRLMVQPVKVVITQESE